MPAPSTIVTFTDADGDEFPVRLYGHAPEHDPQTEKRARQVLAELVEIEELAPTMPVKVTKVEEV
jgi:hypothetical protein